MQSGIYKRNCGWTQAVAASIHRLRLLTVPSRPERDRREVATVQPPVTERMADMAAAHRTAHDMASGPAGNTGDMGDMVAADDTGDTAAASTAGDMTPDTVESP